MGGSKADQPYGSFRGASAPQPAAPPPPAAPRRGRLAFLARPGVREVAFGALLLSAVVFGIVRAPSPALTQNQVAAIARQVLASSTPRPNIAGSIYDKVRPSVVSVRVRLGTPTGTEAQGSGVVLSEQGDILTSLHLVGGAARIRVIFANGAESVAGIVSQQPENDIAVIRAATPPRPLIPAVIGDAGTLRVGDDVFAIGDPFGLVASLSTGVVSGLGRGIIVPGRTQPLNDLIQFDAAVNPGSSGGALVNAACDVVGIITGIAQTGPTGRDVFAGIAFAVKIKNAASAAGTPPY